MPWRSPQAPRHAHHRRQNNVMTLRTLSLALLLPFIVASTAAAQVATPNINPLNGAGTGNPATLPFAAASFVGIAGGKGDVTTTETTGDTKIGSGTVDTRQANLRAVGESFAAALEYESNHLSISPTSSTPFQQDLKQKFTKISAAGRMGDVVGLGLAEERSDIDASATLELLPGTPADVTQKVTSTLPIGGAVVRLADVFYIGVAGGSEKITIDESANVPSVPFSGSQTFEVKRSVKRAGVGMVWTADDGDIVRLEVAAEDRDGYDHPDILGGPDKPEDTREARAAVLEVNMEGFVFGAATRTDKIFKGDVQDSKETQNSATLGWVPKSGMSATIGVLTSERTTENPATPVPNKTEYTTEALSLNWMY